MTVNIKIQAQQLRESFWGPELRSLTQVPPTASTTLWTVSGGSITITAVSVVVVSAMSSTATTLNIGCTVAGTASATSLLNAGTLTSLAVGAVVAGIPVLTAAAPVLTGGVVATAGNITWIASVANTGTCFVTLNYIPLNAGVTVG